jgi:hypothetical protein
MSRRAHFRTGRGLDSAITRHAIGPSRVLELELPGESSCPGADVVDCGGIGEVTSGPWGGVGLGC